MDRRPWSGLLHGEGGEADTAVNLKLIGFTGGGGEPEPHVYVVVGFATKL